MAISQIEIRPGWVRLANRGSWLLVLAALTPLFFFLERPVTVDDTLYLRAAEQILRDPWHPFDSTIGWFTTPTALWVASKNPPGLAYWLAGVHALGGSNERWLHVSLLPFAIAAVLAGGRLARRFAGGSGWVTAVWVASPAFLVSASTLMADVPALAFSLWGVALWVEGVDADRGGARRLGALVAGVALFVKYTSILVLPILALYVLLVVPARRRALLDLWPSLLTSAAWAALDIATHGRSHLIGSLWVVDASRRLSFSGWFLEHGIALLTFVAASGIFPALFLVPALRVSAGRWLVVLAAVLGIGASLVSQSIWSAVSPWAAAGAGVLVAVGAAALLTASREVLRGERDQVFLAAWIGLHAIFIWFWSWTVAVRFVLPLMPPLALLLARALGPHRRWLLAATTAGAIAVSSVVLQADAFPGQFHREVISAVAREAQAGGRRVYFVGAWGFQYYAERAGMRWLDPLDRTVRAGDLILQPHYVANSIMPPVFKPRIEKAAYIDAPVPPLRVHTMHPLVGAGFYASSWGPLPFVIANQPAAGASVWLVTSE